MNKIKLLNTNQEIENSFWVCFDKPIQSSFSNNSSNKKEKIDSLFNLKNTLDNGTFQEFIVDINFKRYIHIEYLLEKHRELFFDNYPSRCACFYAFPTKQDLINSAKLHKMTGIKFILNLKIRDSVPYKAIICNMELISALRSKDITINLNDYWNGIHFPLKYNEKEPITISELLIEGELELIRTFFPNEILPKI